MTERYWFQILLFKRKNRDFSLITRLNEAELKCKEKEVDVPKKNLKV